MSLRRCWVECMTILGDSPDYRQGYEVNRRRTTKKTMALLAGATLLTAPVAAACDSGPSYEQWAETDGAAGRINLDAVQEAFKDSSSATDFEDRVNKIYEGDGIVLIRVEQDGGQTLLEGWEDLNKSKAIEDSEDDRLFSIVEDNGQHEMRGYGANSYYHHGFGAGDFLFTYLIVSSLTGPRYVYYTPVNRYDTISRDRTQYRNSSSYRSQVSKNSNYFNKQKTFAGSQYDQASKNVSSSRQKYLSSQKTTGAFKSSSTGVRSSWGSTSGSSSLSRSRSGFTGGGGSIRFVRG